MKRIYAKYFHTAEGKKMTETVFKARITMLVLAMLACAAVMVSSAFALFTSEIHNTSVLKSATWNVHVEEGGKAVSVYTDEAAPDDMHVFNLRGSGGASGYCVIKVINPEDDIKLFYTDKFSSNFEISIQAAQGCKISFIPHWGDPRDFGIFDTYKNGDTIIHSKTPVEITDEPEEALEGDEGSAPSTGEASAPSEDTPSSDEGSTSGEDVPSSDEGSTSSGDTPSGDEGSAPSEDVPSSDEGSVPSGDTPSGDEGSAPSGDTPSSDDSSTPSGDTPGSDDSSTPSGDTPSGNDSSAPSAGVPSAGDVSAPSSSAPSISEGTTPGSSSAGKSESSSSDSGGSGEGASSAPSSPDGGGE